MGHRSRINGVLNTPETIYARAKTAGWFLKRLKQNATWNSFLLEYLQWVAENLRRPLQDILKEAQKTTGKSGIVSTRKTVKERWASLTACLHVEAKREQVLALYAVLLAPICADSLSPQLVKDLLALDRLTPGDFHAVRSQYDPLFVDAEEGSHKILIDALAKEQSLKVEQQTQRIGFAGGQA